MKLLVRVITRIAVLSAFVLGSLGLGVAAAPQASAFCEGSSRGASVFALVAVNPAGQVTGMESVRQNPGDPNFGLTCDGDGYYAGRLYEGVRNGVCTTASYWYNGQWNAHHRNCTDNTWSNYQAWGSSFPVRLCTNVCSAVETHHGF